MDITRELNDIIIKYKLDKYYPRFQKKIKAEKILIEEFAKCAESKKQIILLAAKADDIEYTKRFLVNRVPFEGYVWGKDEMDTLGEYERKGIYLISLHGREPIIEFLQTKKISYIDIYDLFQMEGCLCEDEYYHLFIDDSYMTTMGFAKRARWMEKPQVEYYFLNKTREGGGNKELYMLCTEKMLFVALYMKNFLLAEECVSQLVDNENGAIISLAWREVQDLLKKMQSQLMKRTKEDIIVFWLDALEYHGYEEMEYFSSIKKESVSFTNAFTVSPHTAPTLKSIFLQKKHVSDRAYKIPKITLANSDMVCWLQKEGYGINIISGYWTELIEPFEVNNKPGLFYPASYIFWCVLENLLLEDKGENKFILAHALLEGHSPFLSPTMKMTSGNLEDRVNEGKKELDRQLEFYNKFLNPASVRIFMSDHGQLRFKTRFHIHMDICKEGLYPRRIESLFSIMDFFPLLKDIVQKGDFEEKNYKRDFLSVEDLDWYSEFEIKEMFRERKLLDIYKFGYKGIINKEYIYLQFSMGVEWSIKRNCLNEMGPFLYPQNQMQIEVDEFIKKMSSYPQEIRGEEKFKYSKYSHKLMEKYHQQSDKVMKILEEVFLRYEDDTVAIRLGGMHSYTLYRLLPVEVRKKISCFIDNNSRCPCKEYGKPVYSLEEFILAVKRNTKIKGVVLSSFDNLKMLYLEAKMYPADIDVVDIYKVLCENGIYCEENFYEKMGMKNSDYDEIYNKLLQDEMR